MHRVPDHVIKFMELAKDLGQGYMFHRLVNELKAHPQLVNKIILDKPIPEDLRPDPIVLLSILNKIENENKTNTLEPTTVHCFHCGRIVKFQGEDRQLIPGDANGFFLCDKCNF